MTVKQLYDWAKTNGCLDKTISLNTVIIGEDNRVIEENLTEEHLSNDLIFVNITQEVTVLKESGWIKQQNICSSTRKITGLQLLVVLYLQ